MFLNAVLGLKVVQNVKIWSIATGSISQVILSHINIDLISDENINESLCIV